MPDRRPPLHRRVGTGLDELFDRAWQAHQAVQAEPAAALWLAFEAGKALIAAKCQMPRSEWGRRLDQAGISMSSARLYIHLALAKDYILASGATSIYQACQLLADTRPRSGAGARARVRAEATARTLEDDGASYAEGYADGYRAGRADGWSEATVEKASVSCVSQPRSTDLCWLISLAHPDRHMGDEKVVLTATRVTQWLNDLRATPKRG